MNKTYSKRTKSHYLALLLNRASFCQFSRAAQEKRNPSENWNCCFPQDFQAELLQY